MQSNDATHQGQDMVTLLSCAKCCISKTHWKKHVLVSVQLPLRLHYAYLPLDVNEVRCFSVVIFSEFVRCQNVSRRVFLYLAVTKKYYYCWWLSKSCTSRENHHFPLSVCALSETIRRWENHDIFFAKGLLLANKNPLWQWTAPLPGLPQLLGHTSWDLGWQGMGTFPWSGCQGVWNNMYVL